MAAKSVAGTKRNDSQSGVGMDDSRRDFVHSTVASACHHNIISLCRELLRKLLAMSGILGVDDFGLEFLFVQILLNKLGKRLLALCSAFGIYYECNFFHVI